MEDIATAPHFFFACSSCWPQRLLDTPLGGWGSRTADTQLIKPRTEGVKTGHRDANLVIFMSTFFSLQAGSGSSRLGVKNLIFYIYIYIYIYI